MFLLDGLISHGGKHYILYLSLINLLLSFFHQGVPFSFNSFFGC